MRKKSIILCLATLTLSGLTACGTRHTHNYDVEHPVWAWTQFSSATVTFTCTSCEDSTEGHTVTLDGKIIDKETAKATCEADGHKTIEASVTFQDKVYTDTKVQTLPKTGHEEDTSSWKYDNTNHWHNCLYCGDSYHFSVGAHTFTDWETTVEPDHYNKGSKERYCSTCKHTEVEEIAMTKFSYDEVKAIYDKFATFDTKSYYISHIGEQLAYSIENINSDDKTAHEGELTEWAKAAKEANDYFNTNFSVVFDAESVDTYNNVTTNQEFYNGYGTVLKVNASDDFIGDDWTYGTNRMIEFEEDIDTLVFAIYNKNPMELIITNEACNKFYHPVTNGTWMANRNTTSCLVDGWTEFQISVSELEDFDSLYIGLYLMGSPYGGYGIPTVKDSSAKGSAYITEVVGIKSAYYKPQAEVVITKIEALKSLDKSNLTLWNGGQIFAARSEVNALPSSVRAYITNLSVLEEYEAAYAEIGTALNTSWQEGLMYPNQIEFTSDIKYDNEYGLYTKLDVTSSKWANHASFSVVGDATITSSSTYKVAIYNPNESIIATNFYQTSWALNATINLEAKKWNVVELDSSWFQGGLATGLTITFTNVVPISDLRITPIYCVK